MFCPGLNSPYICVTCVTNRGSISEKNRSGVEGDNLSYVTAGSVDAAHRESEASVIACFLPTTRSAFIFFF